MKKSHLLWKILVVVMIVSAMMATFIACGEDHVAPNDCVDADGDYKCDVCGAWMTHPHKDENWDDVCDICGEQGKPGVHCDWGYHRDVNGDHMCDDCTKVVGIVEAALNSTLVESEVVALVEVACGFLPFPVSTVCNMIASNYIPKIMQWLEQGLEALDICVKIGLCQSAPGKKVRVPKGIPNDWACDMCQTVVKTVEESMESTKVVEEVSAIVEQLCDLMPTPYSTLCHTLVKTYIGLIMELLDQGLQVLDVCVRIGLCEEKPTPSVKPIKLAADAKKGAACDSCKQIASVVEEAMKSTTVEAEVAALVSQACTVLPSPYSTICSTVEEEIVALVLKVCDLFPAPYGTLCQTVVQEYVPVIVQLIEQGLESLDICVRIGLCDAQKLIDRQFTFRGYVRPGSVRQE